MGLAWAVPIGASVPRAHVLGFDLNSMNKKQKVVGWVALVLFAMCALEGATSRDKEGLVVAAVIAFLYAAAFFLLKDYPPKGTKKQE